MFEHSAITARVKEEVEKRVEKEYREEED